MCRLTPTLLLDCAQAATDCAARCRGEAVWWRVAILTVLLTACGGVTATPTPTPAAVPAVTAIPTAVPTASTTAGATTTMTVTATATARPTPNPFAATALPTNTAIPTTEFFPNTPIPTNAPPPAVVPPPFDPRPYLGQGDRYDCGHFASQAQAQAVLRADPSDPNKLDQGGIPGVACEANPPPRDEVPVPRR